LHRGFIPLTRQKPPRTNPQDQVPTLSAAKPERPGLGGHFKTGHSWTGQNRPREKTQIYDRELSGE
jgi:hypothetical protein